MKEMPERIYLFDCNDAMATPLEGDIEYIRKDFFIEKVCTFLKDRIEHDSIDYPMATIHLIDDFQNFMEGKDDGIQTKFMGSYTTTTETGNGKKYKDYRKDK